MSRAKGILIVWSLVLVILGMSWGLIYAVFIEHPRLNQMGEAMTAAYVEGAKDNLEAGKAALGRFADLRHAYVREVDLHSHWTALGFIGLLIGIVFHQVRFSEETKIKLAWTFLLGSFLFPLGVILQTIYQGMLTQGLAALGAVVTTIALALLAVGFLRKEGEPKE
jgi:hypothetical protein